jgi:long-subunit fatty acid transport protein
MIARYALVAFALLPAALMAQATSSSCEQIDRAVAQSEKEMSQSWASGIADNSAPRATMREQQISNDLQLIAINLALANQLKCPPRKQAVSKNAYFSSALACEAARLKQSSSDTSSPPECDLASWKRDTEK